MTQPAVIHSVAAAAAAHGFADAAPGHRFNLYFPIWRDDWSPDNNRKKDAIKDCTRIPPPVIGLLDGLRARQQTLFAAIPEGLSFAAVSSAPFATGLGNEHPVENGFAFLTPYGLPYLAGSGVKGVLRRAAEELALFSEDFATGNAPAPTLLDVWWLFGFEGAAGAWWPLSASEERNLPDEAKAGRARLRERYLNHLGKLASRPDLPAFIRRVIRPGQERDRYLEDPSQFLAALDHRRGELHNRGALTCWDVFPRPSRGALMVEIMTPHYSDYYQKGGTPNDAGQPTPIPFLAIPPDSQFDFYVVCAKQDLPEALRSAWRPLLESVFDHAFAWLGFGAKTAVGYGQMREDRGAKHQREEALRQAQAAAAAAQAQAAEQEAERVRRDGASPQARLLEDLERQAQGYLDVPAGPARSKQLEDLKALINKLLADGMGLEAAARNDLADRLTALFDRIGWHDPGLDPKKREKQKQKRRDQLAALRGG